MRVLNAGQMREADRRTIEDLGVASLALMENAGRQVASSAAGVFPDRARGRVSVLCGRGNNGGDGLVAARLLGEAGARVSVFLLGRADAVKGDARVNLDALRTLRTSVIEVPDAETWNRVARDALGADLIVDAIFGTGLNAPLSGVAEAVVRQVNAAGVPVVAVDLPSGLSGDTGAVPGTSIVATLTVALGAPKLPHVLPPAQLRCGQVIVADIGIPQAVVDGVEGPRIAVVTRQTVRDAVRPRPPDSHKGNYGRVVLVAGSSGMTGAAYLAAMGALRSGAGLVTVATPIGCQAIVAGMGAEYMTAALPEGATGAVDAVLRIPADVIAVGPGMGANARDVVTGLVERATVPLVVDADGLNAFEGRTRSLRGRPGRDIIITPHPGELARLSGCSAADIQAGRLEAARNLAVAQHLHVVLKGHRTLIATPDGSVFVNTTGNPGMATGGAGDVLTGMTAAWLAQLRHAGRACRTAVHLHGAAGDLARGSVGEIALIAGDLVSHLGPAVLDLQNGTGVDEWPIRL